MTRVFYLVTLITITLLLVTARAIGEQLIAIGSPPQMVVEFSAFENVIRLSHSMDFASVKVTFDDTPGQSVTVAELRGWVKARPKIPPMPPP